MLIPPKPFVSNEEVIQWEISRSGQITLRLDWYVQSAHPRFIKSCNQKKDFRLRGSSCSVTLKAGWQVQHLIEECAKLLQQFRAVQEASLTERLYDIARAAYTVPEFLQARRTKATDKTLEQAQRLLNVRARFAETLKEQDEPYGT